MRIVRDLMFNLVKANIINETFTESPRENGYQPGIDINKIDIRFVLDRLDAVGNDKITVNDPEDWLKLANAHKELINSMKSSSSNVLLKNI